jgi:oligopeptide transport system substrate-binding protein
MKLICCALGVMMSLSFQSTASATNKKLDQLHVKLRPAEKPPFDRRSSVDTLYATIAPILGQLVYTTSSYDLEPGLLESFQWDYKREAYILKIKKGLKFHNGRAVSAKDLEFSLLRGFYSGKPSFFLSFLDNIEGVEAIKGDKKFESGKVSGIKILDDQTLSVKLIKPNPSFLHSLARSYFSVVPIEAFKSDYETWKTFPVGAGSYKVKDHKEKQRILTLERFNSAGSSPSIINMYYGNTDQDSDIDIATHGEDKQIIASKKAATLTSIYFNYQSSVASDLNFRKAISLAVEREKIVDGFEIYEPANEFLAQHFWGRIKAEESRDLEKAKALIRKVPGLDLSKEYKIPVFNGGLENPKTGAYATVLEKQIREIGLKVKFVTSSVKFFPESDKTTLFRLASLGADVADPLVLFGLLRGKSSPMRPHFPVNDKGYEDLFRKALLSDTFDRRVMAVKNLSKYMADNVWMVPLFEKKLMVSVDPKRVKDVGLQDGGLTFFLERTTLQ